MRRAEWCRILCSALMTVIVLSLVNYMIQIQMEEGSRVNFESGVPAQSSRLAVPESSGSAVGLIETKATELRMVPAEAIIEKRADKKTNELIPRKNEEKSPSISNQRLTVKSPTPSSSSKARSPKLSLFSNHIDGKSACPSSTEKKYRTVTNASNFVQDLSWCKAALSDRHVAVGKSWGTLTRSEQKQWDTRKCNEIINAGELLSCNDRWGWGMFKRWMARRYTVVSGVSNVTCAENVKASQLCEMQNIIVDFSKLSASGRTRRFGEGFITTVGQMEQPRKFPPLLGHKHRDIDDLKTLPDRDSANKRKLESKCDVVERRPVFVNTNDDIFNLGHYSNDVMGVWGAVMLSGRAPQESVLINIDGIRNGGPAGVGTYRIMVASAPDTHGPYNGYFESWFGEVKKGVDYGDKKVCFSEIYWPIFPGVAWFWNDWSRVNECSMQAASPLYQSFNLFLRAQWLTKYGPKSLTPPPKDKVQVVIEVRAINPNKQNSHSSARHIRNLDVLVKALETLPNVAVIAADFATMPFPEQVKLSHSASIFISMHGAGTTHIFHSALGSPNCCALVELFPDTSVSLYSAQGYGNLARMFGMHHHRHVSKDGSTSPQGTTLDVAEVRRLVEAASKEVTRTPTCLHDVRDPAHVNTMGLPEFFSYSR